jgi:HNH endonuclease
VRPSRDEILAKRTAKGGFTRATLAEWGVAWPPPKGWMARLLGEPEVIPASVRYDVLKRDGGRCVLCGRGAKDGAILTVDHIKPKSLYPDLPVTADRLQTLCLPCNKGKGGRDETNWRAA